MEDLKMVNKTNMLVFETTFQQIVVVEARV